MATVQYGTMEPSLSGDGPETSGCEALKIRWLQTPRYYGEVAKTKVAQDAGWECIHRGMGVDPRVHVNICRQSYLSIGTRVTR